MDAVEAYRAVNANYDSPIHLDKVAFREWYDTYRRNFLARYNRQRGAELQPEALGRDIFTRAMCRQREDTSSDLVAICERPLDANTLRRLFTKDPDDASVDNAFPIDLMLSDLVLN